MENILVYAFIFVSKVLENALGTLRLILIANGKKTWGAILNFIIILLWVVVAGTVLANVTEDLIKILMYALGSAVGSYLGSYIEEKLAMGSNLVFVVTPVESSLAVSKILRDNNFAVTELNATGKDGNKKVLMLVARRKVKKQIIKLVKKIDPVAMVVTNTTNDIYGGYVY